MVVMITMPTGRHDARLRDNNWGRLCFHESGSGTFLHSRFEYQGWVNQAQPKKNNQPQFIPGSI